MKRFSLQVFSILVTLVAFLIAIALFVPYNPNGYLREFFVKKSMLTRPDRKSGIILVGGSNVAFGFHSQLLSEQSHLPVINMGLHAGLGLKFITEESFPYLKSGDILICSPEYGHFFGDMAYGEQPLADITYLSKKPFFFLSEIKQWKSLIINTPHFLRSKIESSVIRSLNPSKETVYQLSSFNEYGDVVFHWNKNHAKLHIKSKEDTPLSPNITFFKWFIQQLQTIKQQDICIIMLPPSIAQTSYGNIKNNIYTVDSLFKQAGFPFICPPQERCYPDSLFYDTEYHLDSLGAALRTEDLISLLKENGIINSLEL
ncbi:MAG: hypothetical protein NC324_10940 [Bacteroides sp.]|nr:hypothetical protein [Bacteroides sp.]